MKSLKTTLLTLFSLSLVFIGLILVVLIIGISKYNFNANYNSVVDKMANRLPLQRESILISYLIPEQKSALPQLLQKYKNNEDLYNIKIVDTVPSEFTTCTSFMDSSQHCLSMDQNFVSTITPIQDQSKLYGYLVKTKRIETPNYQYNLFLIISIISILIISFLVIFIFIARITSVIIPKSVQNISNWLELALKQDRTDHFNTNTYYSEFENLIVQVKDVLKKHSKIKLENQKLEEMRAKYQVAQQVAHDIRSPLAALDVVAHDLQQLPEDQRLLVRNAIYRIHDIVNDLANKKPTQEKTKFGTFLITSILQSIISEKRVQFRSKAEVVIDSNIESNGYGLFAEIHLVEFKRTISNLINNAVEALPDNKGKIEVSLTHENSNIQIQIKDNGKGIPKDILPKLMNRGETHGKKTGSGLGLYHARQTIESFGGNIRIDSTVGVGTSIHISLPKQPAPKWFVEALNVSAHTKIVILDDDNSIHQIWKNRFDKLSKNLNIELIHFTNPQEFLEKHQSYDADLYLIDYEFLGFKETGLDVIEKASIAQNAILVTSHYEESEVRSHCSKLGVKLIPKNMAGFVPIKQTLKEEGYPKLEVSEKSKQIPPHPASPSVGRGENHLSPLRVDAVLIDDDSMVHMNWKMVAKKKDKTIRVYKDVFSFMGDMKNFDKDTPIYIDSNLEDGVKGEEEAIEINKIGFKNMPRHQNLWVN